nr:MAG TPA: hypothetical protein [Caudoviricetes sp.]
MAVFVRANTAGGKIRTVASNPIAILPQMPPKCKTATKEIAQ